VFYRYQEFLDRLTESVDDFVRATRSSWHVIVFIDARHTEQDAWRQRSEDLVARSHRDDKFSMVPAATLIGDLFVERGVEVRYSVDENDDVLALHAHADSPEPSEDARISPVTILSRDLDFQCYRGRRYATAGGYEITYSMTASAEPVGFALTHVQTDPTFLPRSSVFKKREWKPLPECGSFRDARDQPYAYLVQTELGEYLRGGIGALPYVREFGNPRARLVPFMLHAFQKLGIKVNWEILAIDRSEGLRVHWISGDCAEQHNYEGGDRTLFEVAEAIWPEFNTYPRSYRMSCLIAAAELLAPLQKNSLLALVRNYMLG
jgi:hypothetical protein